MMCHLYHEGIEYLSGIEKYKHHLTNLALILDQLGLLRAVPEYVKKEERKGQGVNVDQLVKTYTDEFPSDQL